MNFILKIVEGPNKGAEIALVEGVAVTLGKGDDCDIVLADPTMPDAPLSVEASADGVVVGGEPLESLVVKTFGATSFAVGPADAPWGELKWPKPEPPEKPDNPEKPETPEKPEKPEKPESPEPPTEPEKKRRGGCFGCLVALLVFLLILIGFAWFFWTEVKPHAVSVWKMVRTGRTDAGESAASASGLSDAQTSDLKGVVEKYGLSLVESEGKVRVSGNLKTRRERLAATAEAYEALPGVELDLSDDESFRTAAEAALDTFSEGKLKVVAATNRVLSVSGSASSPLLLKKALEALNADLPKLRNVDVSGVVISPVGAGKDAGETVDVERREGGRFASPFRVPRRAAKKETQTFPVCGILTTPYPCLVLRDGRRIMEGAAIGDSVIVEIGEDSVTCTNSTGRFTWKP